MAKLTKDLQAIWDKHPKRHAHFKTVAARLLEDLIHDSKDVDKLAAELLRIELETMSYQVTRSRPANIT